MMGGLHIEMSILKLIGDWLDKSGWTHVIAAANVTTQSLLSGSHVSRCHWAHQVTAAALYKLLCISYDEYKETTPDDERLNFKEWCLQIVSNPPQFSYWYKTYQLILENVLLIGVISI